MKIDHRPKWDLYDPFKLHRGTHVTNFESNMFPIYKMTVTQFPSLELEICNEAYDQNGKLINNYYSLHAGENVNDLSDFWKAFEENKLYDPKQDEILNAEFIGVN